MLKIAFVIPWYGEKIAGGAEMELRETAHHLSNIGINVEILSTCVKDATSDWNINYHSPGCTVENGLTVRRFLVRQRNTKKFDIVNERLMKGVIINEKEEKVFLEEMINSPSLYNYISNNIDDYDFFVFIPYMFGTTYYGIQRCKDKAIMIPCFHEESYAHFKTFASLYSQVVGMVFNSYPEKLLTETLMDINKVNQIVMGIGLDINIEGNPDRFRKKFQIEEDFILYAGRKDPGKNIYQLITYFAEYKKRTCSNLKLCLIGGGDVKIPTELENDIYDLGFVSPQDKYDANSAAVCLCQPSVHESFSLVIMESWLCGRPVLVNSCCDVTKNFVRESNGGLYFQNYGEFEICIRYLTENQMIASKMGNNGKIYVKNNFSWETVTQRYLEFFNHLKQIREKIV